MRKVNLAVGENYHIYNRGVEKRIIFSDSNDYWRFIALLIGFQGDVSLNPVSRFVNLIKKMEFENNIFAEIRDKKSVQLISFCLMENHFHLILREIIDGGISKYMQRLLNAYTKYFNTKYKRNGHLFGSRFHSNHIDTDEYLKYLSAYIHLNPGDVKRWQNRIIEYPWSSFTDYGIENRWGDFLSTEILLDQFESKEEYSKFINETTITKTERKLNEISEVVEH